MICVQINKDKDGFIRRVQCEGHAGYADSGYDIICSAVSVLFINTINSIEVFTDTKYKCQTDESKGFIDLVIESTLSEGADILLKALELGLRGIEQDYGKRFINISIKEV